MTPAKMSHRVCWTDVHEKEAKPLTPGKMSHRVCWADLHDEEMNPAGWHQRGACARSSKVRLSEPTGPWTYQ